MGGGGGGGVGMKREGILRRKANARSIYCTRFFVTSRELPMHKLRFHHVMAVGRRKYERQGLQPLYICQNHSFSQIIDIKCDHEAALSHLSEQWPNVGLVCIPIGDLANAASRSQPSRFA